MTANSELFCQLRVFGTSFLSLIILCMMLLSVPCADAKGSKVKIPAAARAVLMKAGKMIEAKDYQGGRLHYSPVSTESTQKWWSGSQGLWPC